MKTSQKTNKELLFSIIVDCQQLMLSHRSQSQRGKRLGREISLLCKNMGYDVEDGEIREILYW